MTEISNTQTLQFNPNNSTKKSTLKDNSTFISNLNKGIKSPIQREENINIYSRVNFNCLVKYDKCKIMDDNYTCLDFNFDGYIDSNEILSMRQVIGGKGRTSFKSFAEDGIYAKFTYDEFEAIITEGKDLDEAIRAKAATTTDKPKAELKDVCSTTLTPEKIDAIAEGKIMLNAMDLARLFAFNRNVSLPKGKTAADFITAETEIPAFHVKDVLALATKLDEPIDLEQYLTNPKGYLKELERKVAIKEGRDPDAPKRTVKNTAAPISDYSGNNQEAICKKIDELDPCDIGLNKKALTRFFSYYNNITLPKGKSLDSMMPDEIHMHSSLLKAIVCRSDKMQKPIDIERLVNEPIDYSIELMDQEEAQAKAQTPAQTSEPTPAPAPETAATPTPAPAQTPKKIKNVAPPPSMPSATEDEAPVSTPTPAPVSNPATTPAPKKIKNVAPPPIEDYLTFLNPFGTKRTLSLSA